MPEIDPYALPTVGEVIAENLNADADFRGEWHRLALARHVAVQLIAYRADNGMTQKDLAGKLGISQPRVAVLESGEKNPRIETLIEITRQTGIEFAVDIRPAEADSPLMTKQAKAQTVEEHDGVAVLTASAPARRPAAAR